MDNGYENMCFVQEKMNIFERKKAIKSSANIALASTRKGKTCWSRALIAKYHASKDNNEDIKNALVEHSIVPKYVNSYNLDINNNRKRNAIIKSKKILKKSCGAIRRRNAHKKIHSVANSSDHSYKKRTNLLKSLVPGGDTLIDDLSLIEETLDYLVFLRAQVDVMKTLTNAATIVRNSSEIDIIDAEL